MEVARNGPKSKDGPTRQRLRARNTLVLGVVNGCAFVGMDRRGVAGCMGDQTFRESRDGA